MRRNVSCVKSSRGTRRPELFTDEPENVRGGGLGGGPCAVVFIVLTYFSECVCVCMFYMYVCIMCVCIYYVFMYVRAYYVCMYVLSLCIFYVFRHILCACT